jgi:hypothetical protein
MKLLTAMVRELVGGGNMLHGTDENFVFKHPVAL